MSPSSPWFVIPMPTPAEAEDSSSEWRIKYAGYYDAEDVEKGAVALWTAVSEKQEETRCILIEFHPDVLDILKYNGLNYVLIYPKKELKEEWIGRYHLKNIDSGIGNARYDTIGLAMHWDVYLDILINEGIHKPSRTHVLHYREKIKQLYLDGLGKTIYMKDGAMFYGYEG